MDASLHSPAQQAARSGELPEHWHGWLAGRQRVRQVRHFQRRDTSRTGLLDLASNDYLGLCGHPAVRQAATQALQGQGAGAGASRIATGTLPVHRELEDALCRYTGRDAALVFSSGYTANLGLLQALGGPGSLFILDAHAHASLVDGARLSGAAVRTAGHNDLAGMRRILEEQRQQARASRAPSRVAVVVESLYSVLGDSADLGAAARLCQEYGALLVVDEAHSLAATPGGSAVRAAGLQHSAHVLVTATLSKALAAQGGAVLLGGQQAGLLREHLLNTARTFIFDTALNPAAAGAARAALQLADAPRRARLMRNVELIGNTLVAAPGWDARVERGTGPILSVRMGSPATAVRATGCLAVQGISVACFRPPSVPDGISRLRITGHAHHETTVLQEALHAIISTVTQEEHS